MFFASHKDFALYFDKLTDKILKLYPNVAFYYSRDPEDYDDELLDSIKLAVCPITLSFLSEDCQIRKKLFPKIIERHISLLPIMEEAGIDQLYYLVCGKIQYLDDISKDDTALDFEHKLKSFLNDILLDEISSDKIRDAFDAYIFLSYRKKDRKHANQIMRLIHKNDFMRDIAIWYDEYLVPGEDYSEAIEDALLKSKLVTLVITPNLVNEENYVKSIEYPLAQKENKPVLPIIAQNTDIDELENSFAKLPLPIRIDETELISELLLNIFKEEGIKENNDPDHLFFIALAYLYGIDVESDSEKAVELLEKASIDGSIEASRKLVNMYIEGQFIEADYTAAEAVLKRLIDQLEKTKESWNRTDYLDTIDYLRQLDHLLVSCREYLKALPLCKKAYKLEQELDEKYPDEFNELLRGQILIDYARTLENLSEYDNVNEMIMQYYESTFDIFMEYYDAYGYDSRWDVLSFFKPMTIASGENQFRMALDADQGIAAMYFDSLAELMKDTDDVDIRVLDLYSSFGHLVNDYCEITLETLDGLSEETKLRRIEELKDYEKTLKAATVILIRSSREEEGIRLSQQYYRNFGSLYRKLKEYDKAKQMYEMAFSLLFDKYDKPDIIYEQLNNARMLIELGDETKDKETLKYAHYELSELLIRLYEASRVDIFKKQYEENEEEIRRKGLQQ
ncbi:MAG: toll/interleukin-1 receptor domain-containing protein [Erysipelotrichaceae bacterium]|nr:toll/interleukin-1 receptor domain-containing protein [Erysipelotrichaceae bacterium]